MSLSLGLFINTFLRAFRRVVAVNLDGIMSAG